MAVRAQIRRLRRAVRTPTRVAVPAGGVWVANAPAVGGYAV